MRPITARTRAAALACTGLLALLLTGSALAQGQGAVAAGERHPVPIYFFWGDGCPYCTQQKAFLELLVQDHPNVVVYDFEVYHVPANRPLMAAMAAAFGRPVSGVPMTFIGDEAWTGYSAALGRQMRDSVERYGGYAAPDPADRVDPALRPLFVAAGSDAGR